MKYKLILQTIGQILILNLVLEKISTLIHILAFRILIAYWFIAIINSNS